jgi:hypothetical protein
MRTRNTVVELGTNDILKIGEVIIWTDPFGQWYLGRNPISDNWNPLEDIRIELSHLARLNRYSEIYRIIITVEVAGYLWLSGYLTTRQLKGAMPILQEKALLVSSPVIIQKRNYTFVVALPGVNDMVNPGHHSSGFLCVNDQGRQVI